MLHSVFLRTSSTHGLVTREFATHEFATLVKTSKSSNAFSKSDRPTVKQQLWFTLNNSLTFVNVCYFLLVHCSSIFHLRTFAGSGVSCYYEFIHETLLFTFVFGIPLRKFAVYNRFESPFTERKLQNTFHLKSRSQRFDVYVLIGSLIKKVCFTPSYWECIFECFSSTCFFCLTCCLSSL